MAFIPLTLAPDSKGQTFAPPQPQAPQGIMANIKNFVQTKIGQPITQAIQSGASDIQSGLSGQGSVVDRTLNLGNGLATGAGAFLAPIMAPISKALAQDPAKGTIMDRLQNSPEFQKFAMTPTGQLLSTVLNNTGKLANIAGATIGLGAGISEVANPTIKTPAVSDTSLTPEQQLQSRIQDATPTYSKNMVGQNVMTADTVDAQGNPVTGQITPRVSAEGGTGKFSTKPRVITTSASETAAGTEANNIPNYPDKGTALEKMLSTQDAISTEAENMRGSLQAEDKANPLDATTEKTKVADIVKSNLPQEIQDKLGYISPADEAKLPPAAKAYREALISQQEETLPKTAAGRYYQQVLDALKEYDGTREGKLNLRQEIDSAYKSARGKLAFGSDSQNALDEVNTDVRNGLNKDLADTTKNTDTQASLKRQNNLYNHKDVLTEKAQAESNTNFGKLEQKYPSLKTLINIGRRQGIMLPIRALEAGLGVTVVGKMLHDLIYNNNK